jgi:hypothetical protein
VTDLVARRGAESRRHGRDQSATTRSQRRNGFGFRGVFGRGGAAVATPGWRRQAPTGFELGRMLTELDGRFTVLSAFDVFGELDADFVVVGPAGVFLITSRTPRGGKVWVDENVLWANGRPTNQIRDARVAADRASARLTAVMGHTVRAIPVIAVMDPHSLSFGGDPAERVVTLPGDLVTQWLSECSRTLSDDAAAYVARVAEDRSTWGSPPSDAAPPTSSGLLARVR